MHERTALRRFIDWLAGLIEQEGTPVTPRTLTFQAKAASATITATLKDASAFLHCEPDTPLADLAMHVHAIALHGPGHDPWQGTVSWVRATPQSYMPSAGTQLDGPVTIMFDMPCNIENEPSLVDEIWQMRGNGRRLQYGPTRWRPAGTSGTARLYWTDIPKDRQRPRHSMCSISNVAGGYWLATARDDGTFREQDGHDYEDVNTIIVDPAGGNTPATACLKNCLKDDAQRALLAQDAHLFGRLPFRNYNRADYDPATGMFAVTANIDYQETVNVHVAPEDLINLNGTGWREFLDAPDGLAFAARMAQQTPHCEPVAMPDSADEARFIEALANPVDQAPLTADRPCNVAAMPYAWDGMDRDADKESKVLIVDTGGAPVQEAAERLPNVLRLWKTDDPSYWTRGRDTLVIIMDGAWTYGGSPLYGARYWCTRTIDYGKYRDKAEPVHAPRHRDTKLTRLRRKINPLLSSIYEDRTTLDPREFTRRLHDGEACLFIPDPNPPTAADFLADAYRWLHSEETWQRPWLTWIPDGPVDEATLATVMESGNITLAYPVEGIPRDRQPKPLVDGVRIIHGNVTVSDPTLDAIIRRQWRDYRNDLLFTQWYGQRTRLYESLPVQDSCREAYVTLVGGPKALERYLQTTRDPDPDARRRDQYDDRWPYGMRLHGYEDGQRERFWQERTGELDAFRNWMDNAKQVWEHALEPLRVHWSLTVRMDPANGSNQKLARIGSQLGIPAMVDLLTQGMPLEDILAIA